MPRKKKNKKQIGPIFIILELTLIIMLLSTVLSIIGVGAQQTSIVNGSLETSLITIKNIFSREGIKYLFSNFVTNLQLFEPLMVFIIALIGISIGEASGLFAYLFEPLKKVKISVITFFTLIISILFTAIGEYSFALLIPFFAVLYKRIGRNPWIGIFTAFLGISIGYGSGIFLSYTDYMLGILTQTAARVDVDLNYSYQLNSNLYITISSSLILAILGTVVVQKMLIPKFARYRKPEELEEFNNSKKALILSALAIFGILAVMIYMLIPGLPLSGMLLDLDQDNYIMQILSPTSPFASSTVVIVSGILMISSYIYGKVSGNIKTSYEYSVGLSKSFEMIGYVFVLMFFASQMLGILEWTNIGNVVACSLINFLATIQLSGIPLICLSFVIIIIITFLIPSALTKWQLASPLLVPLFMRANLTPTFAQFVFSAADGIGKALTPFFGYFYLLIGILEKYNYHEDQKITVFGTIKLIMPAILTLAGIWLLILLGWYIIGLPMGPNVYPTI